MKFIGAGLLWTSFLLIGIKASEYFEKRSVVFNELLLFAEEMSRGICFLSLPLDEIVKGIAENSVCKNLTFIDLFISQNASESDFPQVWKNSILHCVIPLKKSEREKLISFGLSLGRSDCENQKNLLKLYQIQFSTYAQEAYAMKKKYSFTSVLTGLLCGSAAFILLI